MVRQDLSLLLRNLWSFSRHANLKEQNFPRNGCLQIPTIRLTWISVRLCNHESKFVVGKWSPVNTLNIHFMWNPFFSRVIRTSGTFSTWAKIYKLFGSLYYYISCNLESINGEDLEVPLNCSILVIKWFLFLYMFMAVIWFVLFEHFISTMNALSGFNDLQVVDIKFFMVVLYQLLLLFPRSTVPPLPQHIDGYSLILLF